MENTAPVETIKKICDDIQATFTKKPTSENNPQLCGLLDEIKAETENMKGALEGLFKTQLKKVLTNMNSDAEPSNTRFSFRRFRSNSSVDRPDVTEKKNKVIEALERVARQAKYSNAKKLEEDPDWLKLEVVGREKEKEDIIDQLIYLRETQSPPVPVITIVGIAGIGKTRLAQLIYQDEKVKNQVGSPAWVDKDTINNTFDADIIANKVIANINKSSLTQNINVFVVLDDLKVEIGDKDVESLKSKLEKARLSLMAIMITTRSCYVAKEIAAKSYPLLGLNEEDSMSLFEKIPGDNSRITVTKDMRKKIVAQCRGVPLAILTMARLLHSHRSLSTELTEDFLRELKFSYYDDLADNCKLCFAYCSLFPRDYLIDAQRLIHLWMAEGFLEASSSSGAEEASPSYRPEKIGASRLRDLIRSSIFQDVKEDEIGVVRSCRMHPLIHDIARLVREHDPNVQKDGSRASFDFNSPEFSRGIPAPLLDKAKEYITILSFAKAQTGIPLQVEMSTPILENIFKSFKRLCVLDLRDLGITTVPKSIGEMDDLKYLDLSLNNMEKLPSSITKLSKLQTLKLSSCYWLKELPKDLEKLAKLKHLHIDGCLALTHMPPTPTSLYTLSAFVASKNDGLGELESKRELESKSLDNLEGHLEILHLDRIQSVPSKAAYLEKKENLQRLTLRWDPEVKQGKDDLDQSLLNSLKPHSSLEVLILVGYKGPNIPSGWLTSLGGLVKLSLYDCPRCKFLVTDQLPKLKILQLVRLDNLEYIIQEESDKSAGFYSALEELTISDCPKLKSWWEKEKAVKERFDSISKVQVHHCPILTSMPLFPFLDKELVLENSSLELLQDTGLPKLKSMLISGVTSKHHDTLEKRLENFVSLENLHIQNCYHLQNLSDGFQNLSSLQRLTIENCPEINLNGSSNEWKGLKNLRFLTIREIPILKSLSFGDSVTSLRELALHDCHGLTCISESIDKVTSLRKLVISKCRELESLPKAMERLKSLETLIILDCPNLLPRCQPDTGDCWPQIRHIKHIQVKSTFQD